ncbi:hypothetical protein F2Q70_00025498 [Brassica cretica]|uniref:Protein kinase domain-containing protein n=1 Tax=Brassica cretica TaxID=69181 RepID=A0A8S9LCI4_BRACR|nr:hypothetical protein F2Q70_00025498 [Brassica cretica]
MESGQNPDWGNSLRTSDLIFSHPDSRLLLEANDNGIVLRRIWVKCLWSLVTFGSSIRIGGVEIVTRELNTWENDSSRWCLLEILSALTIIAAQTEYIRPVTEAVEGNAVLIAEQLVRILREGDNQAKFAASDLLWDLCLLLDSGVIPLLVELVRDGSLEFRERISGAISQLCYNENDRTSCPGSISSLMIAYKSPEYSLKGQITKKTDVWCLGVLILELLTGRFPENYLTQGYDANMSLVTWVSNMVK